MTRDPLPRVRALCLALPGAHEVTAWGEPTFRVKNRMFATYAAEGNHHGGGRPAVWVKAVASNQALMVKAQPVVTDIIDLYERHAREYGRERGRTLQERAWLDRFAGLLPRGGTVLDIGCGMGEPIARYFIERGFRVAGIDTSPSMIVLCRQRFPDAEWTVADMRELVLPRRFDGIVAWDSFFHLSAADQRGMFPRFRELAAPGAPLLFTSGPAAGEAIGTWCGEPLYHASLGPDEYRQLLLANGFTVQAYMPEDPDCGDHTVWLARKTMPS